MASGKDCDNVFCLGAVDHHGIASGKDCDNVFCLSAAGHHGMASGKDCDNVFCFECCWSSWHGIRYGL